MPIGTVGHQGRLVKTRQNQLEFTGIGIDISNRKNSRYRGLKIIGLDLNRGGIQRQTPIGDRPQLGGQAVEWNQIIGLQAPSRLSLGLDGHRG